MESSKVLFERTLTEIAPLQTESKLRYMLDVVCVGSRKYGVKISQSMRDCVYEARCSALCSTQAQCQKLLRFLYENAVTPMHLEGVIQDLCVQGVLENIKQGNESE